MLRSKYAQPETPTEVELTFSHGGDVYIIKRNPEYMRPAKRGDGMTKELSSAQLTYPDQRILAKKREVDRAVVEILGIDREQFSQISMLAQGDFRKLLLADTTEPMENARMRETASVSISRGSSVMRRISFLQRLRKPGTGICPSSTRRICSKSWWNRTHRQKRAWAKSWNGWNRSWPR